MQLILRQILGLIPILYFKYILLRMYLWELACYRDRPIAPGYKQTILALGTIIQYPLILSAATSASGR